MATLIDRAQEVAAQLQAGSGDRWLHVEAVAARADVLLPADHSQHSLLIAAAWLHDIGYAPSIAESGFHPLDGARFLAQDGFSNDVVGLVAYHSGAQFEADERGLLHELREFEPPNQELLDILTLADMTSSPVGELVSVSDRIREILSRYADDDSVFRAVSRSQTSLRESSRRAAKALGQPSADKGIWRTS